MLEKWMNKTIPDVWTFNNENIEHNIDFENDIIPNWTIWYFLIFSETNMETMTSSAWSAERPRENIEP